MKKTFILLLIIFMLLPSTYVAKANTIKITLYIGKVSAYVNGSKVSLDVPVIIDKQCNRTLVPLRFISEAFGAKVEWKPNNKEVIILLGNKKTELFIGKKTAYVNDTSITMDCMPKILLGRTIVPIRFISETFGAKVEWFPEERKIEITINKDTILQKEISLKADPGAISLIQKTIKTKDSNLNKITFYIAKINLKGKNITILPYLSKGGHNTRESYKSFIARANPIIAINGGTFDLKTNTLTGDVVKKGIPQYIRYDGYEYSETMGITKTNMPFFEDGKINYSIKIDNTKFTLRSVNGCPKHTYNAKVKLFTNWYKEKISAENGEEILIINNNTIKKISHEIYPATLLNGEWALVIDKSLIPDNPRSASVGITINGKDYSGSSFVRCGPLLVKNGHPYIDYSKYKNLNRTMKKGARSLIAFDKSGYFYFIFTPDPVRLNYGELSVALAKCNMFDYVISLDGGGSTLFYYKGKYITKPGRDIIDIITVPSEVKK